ncbi:MAG TPA: efflux RND transporter periplasmic adaptor subunit, partial [Polyangiaceae bacterium]|nr:efflux RND transporter periplasmic adaptor subunit [Polyangiaceae bacterium]
MTSSSQQQAPAPEAVHPDAHLGFELAKPARVSAGRLLAIGAIGAVVLGAAFAVTYLPKRAAEQELEQAATERANALPRFTVVKPKLLSSDRTLTLPGSVQPLEEAVIYPRASGYIR